MNLTFRKLKTVFPRLNTHELTLTDFFQAAEREQIEILELRLRLRGYCLTNRISGEQFIAIRKGQKELQYKETLAHECFHLIGGCSEFEANAFRLVAIIPEPALHSYDWLNENPTRYAFRLWQERIRVKFLHGI